MLAHQREDRPLSDEQIAQFHRDGFLKVSNFFDLATEIQPLKRGIYDLIGILLRKYQVSVHRSPFSAKTFDAGYAELLKANRRYTAELYDAVKMLTPFYRLIASENLERLFTQLRPNSFPGIPSLSYGLRMDNPSEEKFMSPWHQEYPSHLRSMDGIVFWSPLVDIDEKIGPVEFCAGSHREGIFPLCEPKNEGTRSYYGMALRNEETVIGRFRKERPLSKPGDILISDYLTLHRSTDNLTNGPRWSFQIRYFNFLDPVGTSMGWIGRNGKLDEIVKRHHPELFEEKP